MPQESGREDFIVARSGIELNTDDGLPIEATFVPAYHWACAIDDFDGHYDLLVRSADLKPAVRVQRAIQTWLSEREVPLTRQPRPEWVSPAVFHTSLITQNDGHRLEKRTHGVTLPELRAGGMSPSRLLQCFERSFDPSLLTATLVPGALLQEREASRTLADLGLVQGV